jgi:uncharacterized oxidoreductase
MQSQTLNTAQKVAVVTGGSSGIGLSFVTELHAAGWLVYAGGRDQAKLARLTEQLPGVRTFACDVSDRAALASAADRVAAETGKIDLLISNAGGLKEVDFTSPDVASLEFAPQLRDNLEGAINLVCSFLPLLRKSANGRIIVVGSGYGVVPTLRAPIYSAAKAGLHMFAKALRYQLKPTGITVTEVLPPAVDTPAIAHRKVPKLSPAFVAQKTLEAAQSGRPEVYLGQTKMLPVMLRIAPKFIEKIALKS